MKNKKQYFRITEYIISTENVEYRSLSLPAHIVIDEICTLFFISMSSKAKQWVFYGKPFIKIAPHLDMERENDEKGS